MNITIPQDLRGHPIQTLAPDITTSISFGATTLRGSLPTGGEIVRVAVNQDCYMNFGNSSVEATGADIFMPKGSEIFRVPTGATHLALIQASAGGVASVTRMI